VALLVRGDETYRVIETEGGHIDFAPHDSFEDGLLVRLRKKFGRVSIERVLSGSGLQEICAALPGPEPAHRADPALWAAAIAGADEERARAGLKKFCLCLGGAAGDIALVHGADAVVLAGGLTPRIESMLAEFGFAERFLAKGRYRDMMANIPVWMISHPQPGLFGAAAAFRP
jgi:glucokinase